MNTFAAYQKQDCRELRRDFAHRSEALFYLNLAYAKMLTEVGMLSEAEYQIMKKGLIEVQKKVTAEVAKTYEGKADIHYMYQDALYKAIGTDIAGKLHVGRSRNDMYFTMFRMSVRDAIFQVTEHVLEAQKVLQGKIKENYETIIPYYTYGQPSQPGTWAHYLVTIHEMFEDDIQRLKNAYKSVNKCPMGSAAGIGSSFPLNNKRMADLLGFDEVIENCTLGNSAVDYFLETLSAFAILNSTIMRVSSDLVFFATIDCNILNCDKSICGGSSIMPQKKNAMAPSAARVNGQKFLGYFTSSLSAAQSVTLFPSLETFYFFTDFWDNVEILCDDLSVLALTFERSTINKEIAFNKALEGFTCAASMAEVLTQEEKKPFTLTHDVIGGMIHVLLDSDRLQTKNMTPELLKAESKKLLGYEIIRTQKEIEEMLDPLKALNAKITGGTPKPEDVQQLLSKGLKVHQENTHWLQSTKEKIESAYTKAIEG